MKSISCTSIRNHVVLLIPLLFAALIMASPALASSSNWYFYQYRDGCVVDGSRNEELLLSVFLSIFWIYSTFIADSVFFFDGY